jgi:hypothetical protein
MNPLLMVRNLHEDVSYVQKRLQLNLNIHVDFLGFHPSNRSSYDLDDSFLLKYDAMSDPNLPIQHSILTFECRNVLENYHD